MAGAVGQENWSEEFDKFLDFMISVLERFLPWLLSACELLAPYVEGNASDIAWSSIRTLVQERVARSDFESQIPTSEGA